MKTPKVTHVERSVIDSFEGMHRAVTAQFELPGPGGSTYAEIWERDARWLMGPGILSDIIHFQKTRGLIAIRNPRDQAGITITFHTPDVLDATTLDRRNVYDIIVPELQSLYKAKCSEAIRGYVGIIDINLSKYLHESITDHLLYELTAELAMIDRAREARRDDAFWMHLARTFGFNPLILPKPAGIAIHA